MSFILFRKGTPLELKTGEKVNYRELKERGINDHQSRAIFLAVQKEGVDMNTLELWITELKNPKLRAARADKLNTIVVQNTAAGKTLAPLPETVTKARTTKSKGSSSGRTRKGKKGKTFTLYSRSNHQEAEKRAKKIGLMPQSMSGHKVPEGISSEALFVIAEEKAASSLITTGFWTTAA